MPSAIFRFYAELNDFLPPERRQKDFTYRFNGTPAVKDAIEALGVPHTEVEMILVEGEPVGFEHHLRDGERVAVLPMFEALDVSPLLRLRSRPLRRPRFVLDVHLGRLARHLRMLGFDTWYRNDAADQELSAISASEHRILLSRDRGLLKRSEVTHGYHMRRTDPEQQLAEVVDRFDLWSLLEPFTRCLVCNARLEPVEAAAVEGRVPARVLAAHAPPGAFRCCPGCGRIFWPGSHHAAMLRRLAALRAGR